MNHALIPLVPRIATDFGDVDPCWRQLDGTMLSADISGFTALSERLAGVGKQGAEEITELINDCFGRLLNAGYELDGEVVKFGGDAMLVLYRGPSHELRASAAARRMQAALASSAVARQAGLTMSVGVATGPFQVFWVGSGTRDVIIAGRRATEVVRLEDTAASGDILVDERLASVVPHEALGARRADGHLLVGDVEVQPDEIDTTRRHPDLVEGFVHAEIGAQLAAVGGLGGEHRIVTVGFLAVGGVDDLVDADPGSACTALDALVNEVHQISDGFGVVPLHSDIAPNGLKIVLCAGAPVNTGDTADAMLAAALDIVAIDSPLTLRVGVQTGRVFAGFLGTPERHAYTIMGDTVNTAARMLTQANDRDVIAVEGVVADTRRVFDTIELAPFEVKGKSSPMHAARVLGATDDVRRGGSAHEFIGRPEELGLLRRAIAALGSTVVIEGPPGVGKSRLVDAAYDAAERMVELIGSCGPLTVDTPYWAFREPLRSLIGIDSRQTPAEGGRALERFFEQIAPTMVPMAPLLAPVVGAELPESPATETISPEFRRRATHQAFVDALDAGLDRPLLLLIEDAHWIDDASSDLLRHLVSECPGRPWSIVVTTRPLGSWALDVGGNAERIRLGPLPDDAIRTLVASTVTRALPDHELDAIIERSSGNPLFAVELASLLERGGRADDLPATVEQVAGRRIDRLEPEQRRVVRTLSAFGGPFTTADAAHVVEALDLDPEGLAVLDSDLFALTGIRREFRHAMFRDAAYEGLPFRWRRIVHREIGEHLERRVDDPAQAAAALAVHFEAAGDRKRAWRYASTAGRHAMTAAAPADAVAQFERALRNRPHRLAHPQLVDAHEHHAHAAFRLGDFESAFRAFGRARRHAAGTERQRLAVWRGHCRTRQGNYAGALGIFARAASAAAGESDAVEAAARDGLTTVFYFTGRPRRCWDEALAANALARVAGDEIIEAHTALAAFNSGTVLGEPDAAAFASRALELYRTHGDVLGEAEVLNNMGVNAFYDGDWVSAERLYRSTLDLKRRGGDVVGAAVAQLNLAELLIDRGVEADVQELVDHAARNFEASGFAVGLAYTRVLDGRRHLLSGDAVAGVAAIAAGVQQFADLTAIGHEVDACVHLAWAHLAADRNDEATRVVDRLAAVVDAQSEQLESPGRIAAQLELLRSALQRRRGDGAAARSHVEVAIEHARLAGAVEVEAVARLLIDPDDGSAQDVLSSRGIVRVVEHELVARSA